MHAKQLSIMFLDVIADIVGISKDIEFLGHLTKVLKICTFFIYKSASSQKKRDIFQISIGDAVALRCRSFVESCSFSH